MEPLFMPKTGKPIAHAYSRHSTKKQGKTSSNPRQVERAQRWADEKGYELHHVYDNGRSGYTGENRTVGQLGELEAAMRLGELGPNPIVLVEALDRLTREHIDTAIPFFFGLINLGATIIVLNTEKSYKKPMSLPDAVQVLFDLDSAHHYSAIISERVRKAVERRRKAGAIIHTGSSAPKWLRLKPQRNQWEIIPERVALIGWMFDEAIAGRGPEAIARVLNARSEPTWTNAKFWRGTTIHNILRGRMVLGEYTSKKPGIEPAPNYFPAVIDLKRWQMVNDCTLRKAQGRGAGEIKELNLFRGLAVSGLDGTRMILRKSGIKSRKTGTYTWHEYLVSNKTCAGAAEKKHRLLYADVEEALILFFRRIDKTILTRLRLGSENDHSVRLGSAEARAKSIEKQIDRVNRTIADEDTVPKSTLAMLTRLEAELEEAKRMHRALLLASAKAGERPSLPPETDMKRPEVRRALRAEIARWCEGIELFEDYGVVWLGQDGLAVNFKDPNDDGYRFVTREEVKERQAEAKDAAYEADIRKHGFDNG
jgi:DNA invertase Pin-like site-specific DNA recombinase